MKKYGIELEVLSSVILSPRDQNAFYKGVDFDQEELTNTNVNIIYPFYQYGIYEKYIPHLSKNNFCSSGEHGAEKIQYHIPGSSIKGAIFGTSKKGEKNVRNALMVDDIKVDSNDIVLKHIYKLQDVTQFHITKEKNPKNIKTENKEESKIPELNVFFPNVGIQMLKPQVKLKGQIFYDETQKDSATLEKILKQTDEQSRQKLKQLQTRIEKIYEITGNIQNRYKEGILNHLNFMKMAIQDLLYGTSNGTYLLILGGYKGLLMSKIFDNTLQDSIKSGIYLDVEKISGKSNEKTENFKGTFLPYGLVRLELSLYTNQKERES